MKTTVTCSVLLIPLCPRQASPVAPERMKTHSIRTEAESSPGRGKAELLIEKRGPLQKQYGWTPESHSCQAPPRQLRRSPRVFVSEHSVCEHRNGRRRERSFLPVTHTGELVQRKTKAYDGTNFFFYGTNFIHRPFVKIAINIMES